MEDNFSPPDSLFGPLSDDAVMNFDFTDELFFGDFLLDAAAHDFSGASPSTPALFDFPCSSSFDAAVASLNPNPQDKNDAEKSVVAETDPLSIHNQNQLQIIHNEQETTTITRLLCPSCPFSSLKERLEQALMYIKESNPDENMLVQIWVPTKKGDKHVLTTIGQPFALDPNSEMLANYRAVSMNYQFSAQEDSNELLGLPGRVFLGKLPEWTPDVRYYSCNEYPRVDHAHRYDVRGTVALPVFERGSRSCLGVVELVMTTQRINYRPELESICRALQAVNLRSSEVVSVPHLKVMGDGCYEAALPEILEVLRLACETHRLPLAQTWMPCIQQGKKGSRHSDENYTHCVSPVDGACYVIDPRFLGFQEACSEHHLLKGQGEVGKAFTTNQPCFSPDITALSKTEYPLVHYARMFGLRAAVAIRLRSVYTGIADYVLEFLLPVDCRDREEQRLMLDSLSITIQRACQNLRVVTDRELEDENLPWAKEVTPLCEISPESFASEGRTTDIDKLSRLEVVPSLKSSASQELSWVASASETQHGPERMPLGFQNHDTEAFNAASHWAHSGVVLSEGKFSLELKQHHQDASKISASGKSSPFGEFSFANTSSTQGKKRAKTEKNISLQVLRQYFAGSLKDAAKNIGVCPTTLKRICRQQGITRWPSRKIKKVDHSLKQLQVVINSVQGAEGALGSLYANFPKAYSSDLSSQNLSTSNLLFPSKQQSFHLNTSNTKPEVLFSTHVAASKSPSSSCSQNSSSSHFCSARAQQNHATHADASAVDSQCGLVLKRAHSIVELHASSLAEPKPPARSQSHKFLSEHPATLILSPLPESCSSARDPNGSIKVKVTCAEENVRFRIQPNWAFHDLQEEVAKRFGIGDLSTINLKYLDDDSEWVLLTCDADLQECIDIYKTSCSRTIKLSVHDAAHPNTGSSWGSTALS